MYESIPVFPLDKPVVRPLEFVATESEGQQLLLVRDPIGLIEGTLAIGAHPLLLMFIEMADGETTCAEMAQEVSRATGQAVEASLFLDMARQLDEAYLLQSERFRDAFYARRDAFLQAPTRPSTLFDMDNDNRLEFLKQLADEMRRHTKGPKAPPREFDLPKDSVVGLLSPHIDYTRGGQAYAWAYRALLEHGASLRTLIVLGTCHSPASHRFVATRKSFETPFGYVETDQELLDELAKAFGGELYRDEYEHALEHSIELQAAYLKHMFGDACPRIVPILVSSFQDLLEPDLSPDQDEEISSFCSAVKAVLSSHSDVGLIAGVDLSHCGPQFGHEEPNDEARCRSIEARDRELVALIESGKPEAFFDFFRSNHNEQNVCSVAPIYCAMKAFEGKASARLLTYDQSNSEDKECLVSFASMVFLKNQ